MAEIALLQGKRIILGVCGSIAVYKAVDLASKLTQAGAQVDVIMTEAAQRFVRPLTFQAVSGRPVYTDMWRAENSGGLPSHIAHIGLAEGADLLMIAPATANTLAKLAGGFADDLLSVTALAAGCPLLVAPAMDGGMVEHPAVIDNLDALRRRGAHLIEPESGRLASGLTGQRTPARNARHSSGISAASWAWTGSFRATRWWSPLAAHARRLTRCVTSATAPRASKASRSRRRGLTQAPM